ncbi:hypothetical protein HII13_000322 [Brettanomyces bruxellensis]|nr:hypothetical protein HII13_000322 [Brettanomyces bruxellensis]
MSEYKGKTIALISQADIRYVGSLEDIDADKGTISLENVRCLGTEDRVLDPAKVLYPSPEVYEHFQLTGSSVKTLNILDIPVEQVQPVPVPRIGPFAQMGFGFPVGFQPQGCLTGSKPQPQQQQNVKGEDKKVAGGEREVGKGVNKGMEKRAEKETLKKAEKETFKEAEKETLEETGKGKSEKQHGAKETESTTPSNKSVVYEQEKKPEAVDSEFDFDSNNAKFQEIEKKEQGDSVKGDSEQFYNKKTSFFDNLSTSTQQSEHERVKWSVEREKNMDTFGEASTYRGGRGRGRGRGLWIWIQGR